MELKSTKTDAILKEAQKSMNSLLKSQNKIKINSTLTNNQFKLQNRNLLQMEKSSKMIASNFRLIGLSLKGMILNKAFGGLQNMLQGYGSTLSNFNASANKDNSLNTKALERAFQLNTGQNFSNLIDKMGTFASNANIAGSEEQKLLLQSNVNPNEFTKMDSMERFNTLMKIFEQRGKELPFRKMIEEITGQNAKTLESLLAKKNQINKDYQIQKDNLKSSMNGGNFENVARNWDRLSFTFNDTLASLMVELTPLFEKMLEIINSFISSGGVKKTIDTIKDFFTTISDSKLLNSFLNTMEKMKPFFEWLGKTLLYLGGLASDGISSYFDFFGKMIDRVKFLFKSFPLYFENFLLSIQEGLKKLKLNALEFTNFMSVNDDSIKELKREIEVLRVQQSSNDKTINQYSQEITIENKVISSDINQQIKNTSKVYK